MPSEDRRDAPHGVQQSLEPCQKGLRSLAPRVFAVEQLVRLEHGLRFAVGAGSLLSTLGKRGSGQDVKRVTACFLHDRWSNFGVGEDMFAGRACHYPSRHLNVTSWAVEDGMRKKSKGRQEWDGS
jgi:hypothetical protein